MKWISITVMESDEEARKRWEATYKDTPLKELPWEEGKPSQELIELMESGLVEKGTALDICCGSGNNAIYLAGKGFNCHGIDISETAIGYARKKTEDSGLPCRFITGSATGLPYDDETFTLVFDRGCFHGMNPKDRKKYARGVHRVLKAGGIYKLICFSRKDHSGGPPYAFSKEGIKRTFGGLLHIIEIKELSSEEDRPKHFLSALMEKTDKRVKRRLR